MSQYVARCQVVHAVGLRKTFDETTEVGDKRRRMKKSIGHHQKQVLMQKAKETSIKRKRIEMLPQTGFYR